MDASLRLGLRHPLHPVCAGFELQARVHALAADARHHLLVAAVLAGTLADDLAAPAAQFRVAHVHAQQVAGEQRRLGAAGAGAHLDKDIALVVRVARQQQALQLRQQTFRLGTRLGQGVLGQFRHLRVGEHLLRGLDLLLVGVPGAEGMYHRFELRILLAQFAEALGVVLDLRLGQQRGDLAEAFGQLLESVTDIGPHGEDLRWVKTLACPDVALGPGRGVACCRRLSVRGLRAQTLH